MLHDESTDPSDGKLLQEVIDDPRVKQAIALSDPQFPYPQITLQNIWDEQFRIEFFSLSHDQLAAHAVKIWKNLSFSFSLLWIKVDVVSFSSVRCSRLFFRSMTMLRTEECEPTIGILRVFSDPHEKHLASPMSSFVNSPSVHHAWSYTDAWKEIPAGDWFDPLLSTYKHSTMTATPLGSIASAMASAICRVRRSCTRIWTWTMLTVILSHTLQTTAENFDNSKRSKERGNVSETAESLITGRFYSNLRHACLANSPPILCQRKEPWMNKVKG